MHPERLGCQKPEQLAKVLGCLKVCKETGDLLLMYSLAGNVAIEKGSGVEVPFLSGEEMQQ
ncbi:MAG: hypothetical protein Ct9H90mP19_2150 [Gammaproteobacteria bacterium]|nr:MAG: hypothetical protein Ct9H90mP19_2150 [Gammaproteobacteria bacterium]